MLDGAKAARVVWGKSGSKLDRARPWVLRWVAMRTVVRILMIICMLLAALAIS